jgi:hypothetical protein
VSPPPLRNGTPPSTAGPPNCDIAIGSWKACIAPRHSPSVGSSIRETLPTRVTPSLSSDSPRPPTTPAIHVAPNSPTATMPDAIGEMAVASSRPSVSSTVVWAASSASPATGSGGQ